MLNIISLSALRDKVTGPGKVVKNLIKGLDILGYPYVINQALGSTTRLWIHDDISALKKLDTINKNTKVIIGPNLYNFGDLPGNVSFKDIPYIMPCQWIVEFWKKFGYPGILDVWPTGIDTESFPAFSGKKNEVLIYVKKRSDEEVNSVISRLRSKRISYTMIRYGEYKEDIFKRALERAKYVIWIGCAETQGIALGEILSSDVPILLWDVTTLGQWKPANTGDESLFTSEQKLFSHVTSAPYFDDSCGKRILRESEISEAIDFMELNYGTFTPRQYILENLSLVRQAKEFLSLYENHFGLTYEDGMNEKLSHSWIPYHYTWLWRGIFSVYDSQWFQKFRTKLSK